MITEELKHILDSLPSEIHEQARELVKTWKTANDRIINEIFELSEEENDELQQIADEAKVNYLPYYLAHSIIITYLNMY